MAGIFQQTTNSIKELLGAASEGADPEGVRIAYGALRDQWRAAAREARKTQAGSIERFESHASLMGGEAYWPAIDALTNGRDATVELKMAREAAGWIARASQAFAQHDQAMVDRCFELAGMVVGTTRPDSES